MSIIDLSDSLASLSDNIQILKQGNNSIVPIMPDSKILKFAYILFSRPTMDEINVTDQSVVYYITGYCVYKVFQKEACSECKKSFKGERLPEFSKLLDEHNNGNLTHPSFLILQKMFALDYIMNGLCFKSELAKQFLTTEYDKFDLIFKLFETQIDLDVFECIENHSLKSFFKKIFRMYINIFLKKYSEFRNDFRSEKNVRKLLNFNPDADIEADGEFEESN